MSDIPRSTGTIEVVQPHEEIVYPDSDGQPMADNTLQFEWIVTIKGGLEAMFRNDDNVFVAGDLLWYPQQGRPDVRRAPDAMVAFGRPRGYRGSYRQWDEAGVAPHVVFEVLSPGNTPKEMATKHRFYEQYGVEEYYLYDPDDNIVQGWLRQGTLLREISQMNGWISPRLHIRFELLPDTLAIYTPEGERFRTFVEEHEGRRQAEQRAMRAEQRIWQTEQRAREAEKRMQEEALRAREAETRMQEEALRAREAEKRMQKLAAQLRALGIEPEV